VGYDKYLQIDISGRSSNQIMEVLQIFLEKLGTMEKRNNILKKIVRDSVNQGLSGD
jgi:hypothetical protein